MKYLFFLLLFPATVFGSSYNYDKVISVNKGSDNFAFDAVKTAENNGNIEFNGKEIFIDGKKYDVKSSDLPNMYKGKKCSFELVYKGNVLAMVKMYRANAITCYVISQNANVASK